MPEVKQFDFQHRELVAALIKLAGVHEGRWMLQVNFNFTAANLASSQNEANPGVVVAINRIGIVKAEDGAPSNLIVDASEVNPNPKARKKCT